MFSIARCLLIAAVAGGFVASSRAEDADGPQSAAPPQLTFADDFASAQAATTKDRPLVVVFGATWCGWCGKLKSESLASEPVRKLGERFVWVEIDVDDEPELAARFRARSLPKIAVLDAAGVEIASHNGFLRGPELAELLETALDPGRAKPLHEPAATPAVPSPAEVAAQDEARLKAWEALAPEAVDVDVIKDVLTLLARPDRSRRDEALDVLVAWGGHAAPGLLTAMEDERLAIRAAAAQALPLVTSKPFSFDPFASVEERAKRLAAWRSELGLPTTPVEAPAPVKAPAPGVDSPAVPDSSPSPE